MKHAIEWISGDAVSELIKAYQAKNDHQIMRESMLRPVPLLIVQADDGLAMKKHVLTFDKPIEMLQIDGYRRNFAALQAGYFIYILGGTDADGRALRTVRFLLSSGFGASSEP